jgi:hypothetical protein
MLNVLFVCFLCVRPTIAGCKYACFEMKGSCFHFDLHCFIHIHFALCILSTMSLYMFVIFCIVYIFQVLKNNDTIIYNKHK